MDEKFFVRVVAVFDAGLNVVPPLIKACDSQTAGERGTNLRRTADTTNLGGGDEERMFNQIGVGLEDWIGAKRLHE